LEKRQTSYRDKTDEEKQAEAEKWGCDSWDEYVQLYEESDSGLTFPDELDWDEDEDGYEDTPPSLSPSEQIFDEQWWADLSFHGTFEIHEYVRRDPIEWKTIGEVERPEEYALELFIEYELHYNQGDLTDISFMGEHHCSDNPVDDALDKIKAWRQWRDEQSGE
jgi:hypothetical protein